METPLKPVEHLAQRLDVSTDRAYNLIREKIIPAGVVIRLGRHLRINPAKLEEFIERGGAAYEGGWRRKAKDQDDEAA